jgi:hypothetical protein
MLMPLEDYPISKGSVLDPNTWTPLLGSVVVGFGKGTEGRCGRRKKSISTSSQV